MKQVLVILTCLCVLTWTVFGAPTSRRKNCCMRYSTKLPRFNRIEKYEIQKSDGGCRIEAVVFVINGTGTGIGICANPADRKVKDLVKRLSQREDSL